MEKNTSGWKTFIILFYLIVAILRVCAMATLGAYRNMNMIAVIYGVIIGCAIEVALLNVALGYRQITVILYVLGLYQLVTFVQAVSSGGIGSLEEFWVAYIIRIFRIYPLAAISNILSPVYPILLLATAVLQTVHKHNNK